MIFGWDDFVPRLPSRWIGIPGAFGDLAADGARYERLDDAATFVLGDAGINVIVDEVLLTSDD